MTEVENKTERADGPNGSRRRFLKGAAGLGLAAALPTIIPASACGADGFVAPSNRLVFGAIGVGSMGRGDVRVYMREPEVQFVAVCDVDKAHRDGAKAMVDEANGTADCATYLDYRDLIERGDLDVVTTALPDHWHALPVVAAAKAGLDIFGQKPLARSIREGRAMCDAVQRYGRIWQTGSWQRSVRHFRQGAELVRNGRIGKVHRVEVGLPTGNLNEPRPIQPVPPGLDWDRWVGPAPMAPYRGICHGSWRSILDYSAGLLTDWGGHHIDIAHWGLGFDRTGPATIEGRGYYPSDGIFNAPAEYEITCTYANGLVMDIANNLRLRQGTKWIGTDGWIHVSRGGIRAEPAGVLTEAIGPEEEHLYVSEYHPRNFLDCIKTRQPTITPIETAHRTISVALLGEIAMLTGRKIRWNPETEEIADDPGASALLGRSYREPWVL
jgi:predicted dehydrogenase